MKLFTFIVMCYQQAAVVSLALESIRYQITHYGRGQRFQLIAADDGSTDSSQTVIREWLGRHDGLFARIDLLFRKENGGICQNYVDALRWVEGEQFVKLDGDDLLTPYNVFELTDLLEDYDMVCTAFLKFTGSGEIDRKHRTYLEVALQEFIQNKALRRTVKLGCPAAGTAIYRKSLLTDEVYDFILRFRTVNDRACFQKLLTGKRELKTCYVNRPVILYRISDVSVSNFNSPARRLHSREIAQLCSVQREDESSQLLRLLLLFQEKSAVFRVSPNRLVRFWRFFSPYFAIMWWLCVRHWSSIRRLERELVDDHWQDCAAHYRQMVSNSNPFDI